MIDIIETWVHSIETWFLDVITVLYNAIGLGRCGVSHGSGECGHPFSK